MELQKIKSAIEAQTGIIISRQHCNQLDIYYNELIKWSKKVNLCGDINEEVFWLKHVADSWVPHKHINGNESVVDIGSGAGFPGIPLKILYPNIHISIIEKNYKKTVFLKSLLEKISASGYIIINEKFVDSLQLFDKKYDIILLRALKINKMMAERLKPIASGGCRLFLYNGPKSESAQNLIDGGWQIDKVVPGKIPILNHLREVTIFEDVSRETSSC